MRLAWAALSPCSYRNRCNWSPDMWRKWITLTEIYTSLVVSQLFLFSSSAVEGNYSDDFLWVQASVVCVRACVCVRVCKLTAICTNALCYLPDRLRVCVSFAWPTVTVKSNQLCWRVYHRNHPAMFICCHTYVSFRPKVFVLHIGQYWNMPHGMQRFAVSMQCLFFVSNWQWKQ